MTVGGLPQGTAAELSEPYPPQTHTHTIQHLERRVRNCPKTAPAHGKGALGTRPSQPLLSTELHPPQRASQGQPQVLHSRHHSLVTLGESGQQLLQDLVQLVHRWGSVEFHCCFDSAQAWWGRQRGPWGWAGAAQSREPRAVPTLRRGQGRGLLAGPRDGGGQQREGEHAGVCAGHDHGQGDCPHGEGQPRGQ